MRVEGQRDPLPQDRRDISKFVLLGRGQGTHKLREWRAKIFLKHLEKLAVQNMCGEMEISPSVTGEREQVPKERALPIWGGEQNLMFSLSLCEVRNEVINSQWKGREEEDWKLKDTENVWNYLCGGQGMHPSWNTQDCVQDHCG